MQVKLEMRLTAAFGFAKLKLKRLQVSHRVTISETLPKIFPELCQCFCGNADELFGGGKAHGAGQEWCMIQE